MAAPRYQHTVILTEELELAWRQQAKSLPSLSFNAFIADLMKEALCVSAAPTSTIP